MLCRAIDIAGYDRNSIFYFVDAVILVSHSWNVDKSCILVSHLVLSCSGHSSCKFSPHRIRSISSRIMKTLVIIA